MSALIIGAAAEDREREPAANCRHPVTARLHDNQGSATVITREGA